MISHSVTSTARATPARSQGAHLALLIGMNLIWGLNLIASKIGVGAVSADLFHCPALRLARDFCCFRSLKVASRPDDQLLAAAMLTGPAAFSLLFTGMYHGRRCGDGRRREPDGRAVLDAVVDLAARRNDPLAPPLGITLAFGGMAHHQLRSARVRSTGKVWRWSSRRASFRSLGLIFVKRLKDIRALNCRRGSRVVGGPMLLLLSLLLETGQWAAMRRELAGLGSLFFTTMMSSLIAHTALVLPRQQLPGHEPVADHVAVAVVRHLFRRDVADDQLTPRMLLGGAVTLVGVFIVVMREKRLVDTGT